MLPERPADQAPVVRSESERDDRQQRDPRRGHSQQREEHERHCRGREHRRRERGDEIRRERGIHVDQMGGVEDRGGNRREERGGQRVRGPVVPVAIARERRPFGESGAFGHDAIEPKGVGHGEFTGGEFRRLRVHGPDFAAVAVVDRHEAEAKDESDLPGTARDEAVHWCERP